MMSDWRKLPVTYHCFGFEVQYCYETIDCRTFPRFVPVHGIAGLCAGDCPLLFQNDGYPEWPLTEHRISDSAGQERFYVVRNQRWSEPL